MDYLLSNPERRLAAIMFTDMIGYTALSQRDEALALRLLGEQQAILRSCLPQHKGREIKTMGDAFLVEFASAVEAVRCAADVQRKLHETNLTVQPQDRTVLRIGIHLGDVTYNGSDVYGDAVNIASRIEPLADPGGICVSDQVYALVKNKLEYPIVRVGTKQLKNVQDAMEVYKIVLPWGEEEAPPHEIPVERNRMIVLPFKSLSPDPNDEYFADGITEELITALSGIQNLDVIAKTTAMRYKDSAKTAFEIGKALNSNSLIEGSVRKAGNRVRIGVQLIDTRNESHLWAENYDRQLDDIFQVQSDIANKVAEALELRLASRDLEHRAPPTTSLDAYTLYLKGRYLWGKRDREAMIQALECHRRAIEKDPSFALGYSGLAECYATLAGLGMGDRTSNIAKARDYATKALRMDDRLTEARTVLAFIFAFYDYDQKRAQQEFERAIELNPSYPTAHVWYAGMLTFQGRFDEAYKEFRRALDVDPLALKPNADLGFYYSLKGENDKAIEQLKKVLQAAPDFPPAHGFLIVAYSRNRMYDQAIKQAETLWGGLGPKNPPMNDLVLSWVHAKMGNVERARLLLARVEEQWQYVKLQPFVPLTIAVVHFLLHEIDKGFEWLTKGVNEHDPLILLLKVTPELDEVRSDPRYVALLKKLGLELSEASSSISPEMKR